MPLAAAVISAVIFPELLGKSSEQRALNSRCQN